MVKFSDLTKEQQQELLIEKYTKQYNIDGLTDDELRIFFWFIDKDYIKDIPLYIDIIIKKE